MKKTVSANSISQRVMKVTAMIAAATILIGPATAAEQQMLTNSSLPVGALSERQTRRLLSGANLKAKTKSAMRLSTKKPQVAVAPTAVSPAVGSAAPAAVTDELRGPITEGSDTTAAAGTTAPGWSDEPAATSAPIASAPVASAPVASAPVATVSTPVVTQIAPTAPVAVTAPVAEVSAPVATSAPVADVATTTTTTTVVTPTSEAAQVATTTVETAPVATADAATSGDAPAGDAVAGETTADATAAAVATTKQGEFTTPTTLGNGLLKSDGIVASNPAMSDAMITGSPSITQVGDGPIVIDNDEMVEQTVSIAYEEMPTEAGGTAVKAGARFPVVMMSEINSKTAKKGDAIECRLKYDLKIGDRHIANKGSRVRGHLDYVLKARTVLGSLVSVNRFYRNSGVLGLAFDELINENGEHFKLVAKPAMMDRIIKNKYEGRELGVNHNGQVVGPFSQQLRYKAIRVGMNFAMAPAGVFSFGAMPVALGLIGAANPSFAFMKPVGLNVRHRRIKGFAWGFLSGIPGSWLIEDTTVRGQEAIIKPGDEFLAVFNEQFNGTAMTDAEMMPGAGSKVKGEVLSGVKEKPKKK